MNPIFATLPDTVFDVMSGLAREHGAINLGQGFPEWDGPLKIRQRAADALLRESNQYPPMRGLPVLREAVAQHYRTLQGVDLDWRSEVTITSGATEALAAALLCILSPGDEVVLFEPMYDSYLPMLRRAGAQARFVRLQPPDWRIDPDSLARAFNSKTRAVVINTPNNPTGNVMKPEDMALIAGQCVKHDCIAISDEVWECCTFNGASHISMLSQHGMRERTIKVGSAGKMFSTTGWKVGFACAAPRLTEAFAKAHQFLTFTTPPNLQHAVAFGLNECPDELHKVHDRLGRARNRLTTALEQAGFAVLPSEGTYFLAVDLRASGINMKDEAFAVRAVKECGVASIPFSAFHVTPPDSSLIRLCFAKSDDTLDRAVERLVAARRLMS